MKNTTYRLLSTTMVVGVDMLLKGGVIVVVEAVDAVVVVVIGSCILNRSLD